MSSQNTFGKVRLNDKVESRVRGDLYARFGGECLETYHCKKWQGAGCLAYGIVHSDEFVANRFAVANPNLRPLFDAIDVAQKSGNVGKLTMDDVMAVSRHTQSTPKSSSHTTSIGGDTNKDTAMLIASVNLLNSAVKKLSNRLDKDINAIVTISGRNGVAEKMDTYNQMINNKKR